jgi:hypothetical protein
MLLETTLLAVVFNAIKLGNKNKAQGQRQDEQH